MYLSHWNTGGRRWGLSLWEKKKLLMFSLPLLSHASLSGCAPHGGAGYKSLHLGGYHFIALLVLGALPVSCCSVIRADQASVWLGQLSRGRPRSGCSQKARGRPRVKLLHVPAGLPLSGREADMGCSVVTVAPPASGGACCLPLSLDLSWPGLGISTGSDPAFRLFKVLLVPYAFPPAEA